MSSSQPMVGVKKDYSYRKLVFAGETFTLGDCVAIKNEDDSSKDFIAKIMKISTNSIPRVNVDVVYFYRPEELKAEFKGAKSASFKSNELIASNYTDTLDVFTINNKVMVYEGTLDSLKKIRGAKAPETSAGYPMEEFVVSQFYNITTKKLAQIKNNKVWAKVNETISDLAKKLENRAKEKTKKKSSGMAVKSPKRSTTPSKSTDGPRSKKSK